MRFCDYLNQLLALLWKSWKTLIRSKGWLITQFVVLLILWGLLVFIMRNERTATLIRRERELRQIKDQEAKIKDGGEDDNKEIKPFDDLRGFDFKCVNDRGANVSCSAEIGESTMETCKKLIDELNAEEASRPLVQEDGGTVPRRDPRDPQKDCRPESRDWDTLLIREFSRTTIDIDFYETCPAFSTAAKQFEEQPPRYFGSCPNDGPPLFRRIAAYSGKMTDLTVRMLPRITKRTDFEEDRHFLVLMACAVPVIFFCAQVTMEIAQEANSLIKDYLLSVGMSRLLYFSHHFIFHFLKTWIAVIGSAIIIGWAYDSVSMALYMFGVATLALAAWMAIALFIGTCFKKPGIGAFATLLVLVVMFVVSSSVPIPRTNVPLSFLCCLIPNVAMALILDAKNEAEMRGENVVFSEVSEAVPQGFLMLMLVFDFFLYFFLAILVDLLRSSFENPLSLLRKSASKVEEENKSLIENREDSDKEMKAALCIEGVHKMYSSGEHAVRGVNMRMYKGQVTALLGHNGAGKSTTFSMISGMTVPTKGRIQIGDEDSKAGRQKLIGFCPQYNAIFPKLTVDEHLIFFAKLKGVDSTNGDAVLGALGMSDKGGARASTLSGGMKRKLCIAIAFAADSPIILLDEPTAGMDTGARRDFERLLLDRKKNHTILLTTHYTDEAEMLADRIFIMARGKVFCSGSAQFLRKKFDSGFILSFAVEKESDIDKAAEEMMKIATEFVPNVSMYKKRAKQFELKLSTDDTTRFCEMFRKIESNGKSVGLQSYGLSMNKLEQVFLKVGELTGTVDRSAEVDTAMKELIQENDNRSEGPGKVLKQIRANLMKRLSYELVHIPSLVFMLALLFAASYGLFAHFSPPKAAKESHSADTKSLLAISDSYRIIIDSSLHDNFAEIKRLSAQFGDRLTIEKCGSIPDWYKKSGNSRPPILGGLSRNGDAWTVFTHPRFQQYLPTLEAIAAMVNNPTLKKVEFNYRKEKLHEEPSPWTREDEKTDSNEEKDATQAEIMIFGFVLAFLSCLMCIRPVTFLIAERVSNFGHQQRLTGVSRFITVLSGILFDFALFLVHFACYITAAFLGSKQFATEHTAALIYMPLVGFMSDELAVTLLSRLFATPAMGHVVVFIVLFSRVILVVVLSALVNFKSSGRYTGKSPFSILNPQMALGEYNIKKIALTNAAIFILIHFIILIVLFIIFEFGLITKWRRRRNKQHSNVEESKPALENFVLRVDNLEKWYGKEVHAVRGITFGVRAHECFGVLGINGAGKTSTFEVLTGNTLPTVGTATVSGVDCSTPATIGYCPQMDALIEDLTGRQSLVILAALHGYDNPGYVADVVITCVGMQEHADRRSKRYSGGQRRKISVAASLLAQNSLIILDEPTAGIDPIARRDIWSVICALRESTNTAIVLTSHSMDEVEALVSNLIILREGLIAVEGSPQMIKNQFGDHYNFNLVIASVTDVGQITTSVVAGFPSATLYDSASLKNIKYSIPRRPSDVFSEIFEKASTIAKELNATDFSFTQATLEDAFLLAATAKPEGDNGAPLAPSMTATASSSKLPEMTASAGKTTSTEGSPIKSSKKTGKDV